jgi:subtilisin family serine protease
MKHVILRTPVSSGLESARPGARGGRPAVVDVSVDDIDSRRVQSLARSRGVLAIAPVMPVKLVTPIPMSADAQPAGGVAWGVGAVGAESSPFTGEGIVVSVLDTGIDASHPAFSGVELVQQDFTGEGNGDEHGHGTHCAGTIFGREVEGTRIGVATGVNKALIGKVLGAEGGSSDQILKAIQWAIDGGATVISMSLGMDFPGLVAQLLEEDFPADLATSIALEGYRSNVMLFERLASLVRAQATFAQPAMLVAAAGNESRRSENPDFVINVAPPAVAEGMLSVAAVGDSPDGFSVAPFSNVGAMVSGPGVGIPSARRGGGLTSMSGTSMATPHVAGVAALWAQKLKAVNQLTAANLSARLVGSATTDGMKAGFDPVDVGAGLVRAPQA